MTLDPVEALQRSPVFELLSRAELEVLARLCRPVSWAVGEVVFREGDPGASLFIITAGEVEVLHRDGGNDKVIAVLAAPAAFGEMALVDREARSATIRARTATEALELTAEAFTAFRKRSRDGFTFVVINVARILSSRLRETSQRLASRL
ncbi:MAG TPA: cyclic nucleotide-binding domain-containing protein [Anaeromyxobacter sp.]|nr:cyclic nucleotide-binding domain-containing protein [Anaeromyxobacter sp.]